jgi:hypothetical protein
MTSMACEDIVIVSQESARSDTDRLLPLLTVEKADDFPTQKTFHHQPIQLPDTHHVRIKLQFLFFF